MKSIIISIIRIIILSALCFYIALFGLGVENDDENLIRWILTVIWDKGTAILALFTFGKLFSRWEKEDKWVRCLNKIMSK